MSFYGSRITNYVEGKNEEEVMKQLVSIGAAMQQKVEVISVYHNSSRGKVVAWYFHDIKSNAPIPRPKKTTKKKVVKKVE